MHTFLAYLAVFATMAFMWFFSSGIANIQMLLIAIASKNELSQKHTRLVDVLSDRQIYGMTATTVYLAWYIFVYNM